MWNYFSRLFLVTELGKNLGNIPMSRAFTVHLRTFGVPSAHEIMAYKTRGNGNGSSKADAAG
jgi:hypothetical protein